MWTRRISAGVEALAYAPDGGTLYAADRGGLVTAWDLATREPSPLFRLPASNREKLSALHVLDGRYLVVDLGDRSWSWDLAERRRGRRDLPGSADGMRPAPSGPFVRYVAYGTLGRNAIKSFDVRTGKTATVVPGSRGLTDASQFAFSPDDRRVVAARFADDALLLDLSAGRPVRLPEPADFLSEVQFSPDGRFLVWDGSCGVEVWDAPPATGGRTRPFKTVRIRPVPCSAPAGGLAFHPTAPVFAALDLVTSKLTLFSLETSEPLRTLDFGLGRYVRCVAFSPDGLTCAVGGSNKQFAVFDVDV